MEFLKLYKSEILRIAAYLALPFLVFLIALASVYLFGRMLGLVKSQRAKNAIAFLSMAGAYVFYFWRIDCKAAVINRVWMGLAYMAVSIILYVLVGFKLYDRVDAFLDKRVGKDKAHRKA